MSGLKRYKKELFACLGGSEEEKNFCISRMEASLGEDAHTLSYEEITERLGDPVQVAAGFADESESISLVKESAHRRKSNRWLWAVLIVVLALVIGFIIWVAVDAKLNSGGTGHFSEPSIIWKEE